MNEKTHLRTHGTTRHNTQHTGKMWHTREWDVRRRRTGVIGSELLAHAEGERVVVRELVEVGLAQRIVGHGAEALCHRDTLTVEEVGELRARTVVELLLRVAIADKPGRCPPAHNERSQEAE